jgi:hypothetical protein
LAFQVVLETHGRTAANTTITACIVQSQQANITTRSRQTAQGLGNQAPHHLQTAQRRHKADGRMAALTLRHAQTHSLGLRVPDGFEVTEFADSSLANDIYCLTLDSKGRVVEGEERVQ